jgi:hypothetical protein
MTTVDDTRPRSAWQRAAAWVLVVLMAVAVSGSVVGFWVNRTVLDTDEFMAVVSPIVENESVQTVVADRIGDQLVEALDIEARLGERISQAEDRLRQRLADALELPGFVARRLENATFGLDALAPMIAAGVETRIRDAVDTFISSPEGSRLLLTTIEIAHERSVLLLRDQLEQLPNVVVAEGEVRLNLVPLMAEVLRSVVNAGLDFIGIEREIPAFESVDDATEAVQRLAAVLNRDLPPDFGQVRIASEASLEQAQGIVRAFDVALWLLVIVGLVLAALAVWLAPSIPAGLMRIGVAAALAALVGWFAVQLISTQVAETATTADGRVALGAIVSSVVNGLSGIALALAIAGIGVGVVGLVADRRGGTLPAPAVADEIPTAPPSEAAPLPAAPIPAPTTRKRRTAKSTAATSTTSTRKPRTSDATSAPEPPTKKRRRPPATGA